MAEDTSITKLFRAYDSPDVPGISVMLIKDGQPLFARGYGAANLEERIPCTINTRFRLASVTKQFTAMAILLLTEEKKLALSEPLTEFFPEFPAYGRRITVRHLLNHTSGLPDYERLIPNVTRLPVLDQDVLRLLMLQKRAHFPAGTRYRYSNSAYALLALIVQVRSGNTFAHFLQRRIFEPLKMSGSLAYERGLSIITKRAYGYSRHGRGFQRADQSLTSSVLGDGGLYSSVCDLQRWDHALYTSTLVNSKLLKLAFTPGVRTDLPGIGYGFGWYIGRYRGVKEIWHSGDTVGFRTRITRFPQKKFTVILLANRSEAELAGLTYKLADRFWD